MTRVKVSLDEKGWLRALAEDTCPALSWFLEQDVQRDVNTCDEIIAQCDRVASTGETLEITGNAHSVTIGVDSVKIETLFAEPPVVCFLTLMDFRDAVRVWRDAVG